MGAPGYDRLTLTAPPGKEIIFLNASDSTVKFKLVDARPETDERRQKTARVIRVPDTQKDPNDPATV